MTKRSLNQRCGLPLACALLCASWNGLAWAQAPATVVELKESAHVTRSQVLLGDVASIVDPDPQRREHLASVDLALLEGDQDKTLEQSFIHIRLLLAGFSADSFKLTGAERVTVSSRPAAGLTDLGLERIVLKSLSRQFEVPEDELQVRLISPFFGPWLNAPEELKNVRVEVVPPAMLPLGRSQLTVRILSGERVVAARPASVEVARRQNVVVALSSLDRSHVVTAGHLREEVRFVDAPVDQLSRAELTGRKVLMPLKPGEIVTLRHIGAEAEEELPIVIRARDAVRLVARKKGLTVVVPTAEALQNGRPGQLIRVRNIESNRVVTGRVVDRGEVEVPLN